MKLQPRVPLPSPALVAILCLLVSGCRRKESTTTAAPAPVRSHESVEALVGAPPAGTAAPPAPGGAAEPASATPAAGAPSSGPNLERLNQALDLFVGSRHRLPKDIAELCREEELYPPVPPAGQKYVIDPRVKKIVLIGGL